MIEYLHRHAVASALIALFIVVSAMAFYLFLEPTVGRSQSAQDEFTVRQEITGAISFLTGANNIELTGPIDGLTGGTATGSVYAVVSTNSGTGYTMTLAFEDNSGNGNPNAMEGDTTGAIHIWDYSDSGEPDFNFTASSAAQFAYTVFSSSTNAYVDDSFKDFGGSCNNGAGTVNTYKCWKGPTTAGFPIIDTSGQAQIIQDRSTSTVKFVVHVPNTPDPALSAEFYTATATLTATVN